MKNLDPREIAIEERGRQQQIAERQRQQDMEDRKRQTQQLKELNLRQIFEKIIVNQGSAVKSLSECCSGRALTVFGNNYECAGGSAKKK